MTPYSHKYLDYQAKIRKHENRVREYNNLAIEEHVKRMYMVQPNCFKPWIYKAELEVWDRWKNSHPVHWIGRRK